MVLVHMTELFLYLNPWVAKEKKNKNHQQRECQQA
jgi:hypothetical protein